MQAYATEERLAPSEQHHPLDLTPLGPPREPATRSDLNGAVVGQLIGRLADLIAERLAERQANRMEETTFEWLDARGAANYLGLHRDTVRKLAAERAIPVHQDRPGCKLFFRSDELDDWRRTRRYARSHLRAVS